MPANSLVEDHLALKSLKHRYCYHIDHGEYEQWAGLFSEDGAFHRGSDDTYRGYDELLTFAADIFDEEYEYSAHIVMNPIIEVNKNEATARWYLYLPFAKSDGSVGWMQGDYYDEYRRIDGDWMIDSVQISPNAMDTSSNAQF